jgi:purine-nucleoside phosphorylase
MEIGDLVVLDKSLCGDGFSRYLDENVLTRDCFLNPVEPDSGLAEIIKSHALEVCQRESISLHLGTVFSIDSIVAQFFRLDYLVSNFDCIGIEMETSSVFRAARLVGIRASALLQVSDVIPANKSLFSGRTKDDMERRNSIREGILARVILDSIIDSAAKKEV